MTEEKKRKAALFLLAFFAVAPLFLFGITGWRWRIINVTLPWPIPLPILLPESAA